MLIEFDEREKMESRRIIQLVAVTLLCATQAAFAADAGRHVFIVASKRAVVDFYRLISVRAASEEENEDNWQAGIALFDRSAPEDQREMLTVEDQHGACALVGVVCDETAGKVADLVERYNRHGIDITGIGLLRRNGERLNLLQLTQIAQEQGVPGRDPVIEYLKPIFDNSRERVLQPEEKEGGSNSR